MKHLIIVPVYNSPSLTEKTLRGMIKNTDLSANTVCVVDDYSDKKTTNLLKDFKQKFPKLRIFRSKKNSGKPSAINAAMRKFPQMDYYTVIDNDVVIKSSDWVKTLKTCHKLLKNKAILGAFTEEKGFVTKKGKFNLYDPYPFMNLAGRFFSIPKQIFKEVGYFSDGGYRHEDAEYCKRAALANFRWYYIRNIKAATAKRAMDKDRTVLLQKDQSERTGSYRERMGYLMKTHKIHYKPAKFIEILEVF